MITDRYSGYDILAGAIIGTVMAFSAYRMLYASVWDFRFNHIPLNRHVPFGYLYSEGAPGFQDTVFTRRAGWGSPEAAAMGGAPFDATRGGMGGAGAGFGQNAAYNDKQGMFGRHSVERRPVPGATNADHMV